MYDINPGHSDSAYTLVCCLSLASVATRVLRVSYKVSYIYCKGIDKFEF